jgi:hypothetical protein
VLFQRNPVSRSNQTLGWQNACRWAPGNSLDADKFGNRLTIVLRHDPPCVVMSKRAVIAEFAARRVNDRVFVTEYILSCQYVK